MNIRNNIVLRPFLLLIKAFRNCWDEIWKSVFVMAIITILLATVFYWVESPFQEEYSNWWHDVVWAFCVYIDDPGDIGGEGPVTHGGKIIATILGLLNILIVAVPAGIIASGFTSALEEDKKDKADKGNSARVGGFFKRMQDRATKRRYVRPYATIPALQARCQLSEQEIIDAVNCSDSLRLCDLADTYPLGTNALGQLVVESFPRNTDYGCLINRGSNVTIVSTSSTTEPGIGWFAWHLARYGNFNYLSKEVDADPENPQSFYILPQNRSEIGGRLHAFMKAVNTLAIGAKETPWVIFLLSTSGADTPSHPTQFHFTLGAKKGDETYDSPNLTVTDVKTFDSLFKEVNEMLKSRFGLEADHHRYNGSTPRDLPSQKIGDTQAFTIRIAFDVTMRDPRRVEIISSLAQIIHDLLDSLHSLPDEADLKAPGVGYEIPNTKNKTANGKSIHIQYRRSEL